MEPFLDRPSTTSLLLAARVMEKCLMKILEIKRISIIVTRARLST